MPPSYRSIRSSLSLGIVREIVLKEARELPVGSFHVIIDPAAGSERLLQRALILPPGGTSGVGHPGADDALYVARGSGLLVSGIGEEERSVRSGSAALIPAKVPAYVVDTGGDELVVVSVLSPPPFDGFFTMEARDLPVTTVQEEGRPSLPAGEDRHFKVLIESEHVTQFVGFIDKSKAPLHAHTYEEAIYVLAGEGLLHADGRSRPIRQGTSMFLPPGAPHCLENQGPGSLKVLGVFSPPGSPAGKEGVPESRD
jgi:mannose-6-phosphate isomerase-like protein (cupin superfamily)